MLQKRHQGVVYNSFQRTIETSLVEYSHNYCFLQLKGYIFWNMQSCWLTLQLNDQFVPITAMRSFPVTVIKKKSGMGKLLHCFFFFIYSIYGLHKFVCGIPFQRFQSRLKSECVRFYFFFFLFCFLRKVCPLHTYN